MGVEEHKPKCTADRGRLRRSFQLPCAKKNIEILRNLKVVLVFLLSLSFVSPVFALPSAADSVAPEKPAPRLEDTPGWPALIEGSSMITQEEDVDTPLGIQSTIERFLDTQWNVNDQSAANVTQNSDTVSQLAPIANEEYVRDDSQQNLNSTESEQMLIESEGIDDGGTTLYSDECDSTAGWYARSTWGGEQLLSEIQTGISLLVDNGRYRSSAIPSSQSYLHGPMFTRNLTYPAAVGEGLDLHVVLEHEYVSSTMGDVGVAVYDMAGEIIFRIWLHDAWYSSRSDVIVGYYFLDWQGGGAQTYSVQMSSSWYTGFRIWYDKEDDAIKANVAGSGVTLVSNPSEEELDRTALTVAVYFARNKYYNFKSSFIDSIELGVDTSPQTGHPATPLTPAMSGHWFPQMSYSRLYFEVYQPYLDYHYCLRIRIEADQDEYDRTLTVTVQGVQLYSGVIKDEDGFDGVITVPSQLVGIGTHKVVVQINYGAYVPKGWKLTYFYPERAFGEPLEVLSEYFPQQNPARLTYLARLGPNSVINIAQEADQDHYARTTRAYVDGQLKQSATGDHAWEWSLGDYTHDSLHEVTIELQYGGYAEWGKKLTINRVHHLAGSVEIDYMPGHAPTRDDLDVLEAYYINMGYHRTEFHLDDEVPYAYMFEFRMEDGYMSQQYWDYRNAYRDHDGDATWA
jgi:hypothetical protein